MKAGGCLSFPKSPPRVSWGAAGKCGMSVYLHLPLSLLYLPLAQYTYSQTIPHLSIFFLHAYLYLHISKSIYHLLFLSILCLYMYPSIFKPSPSIVVFLCLSVYIYIHLRLYLYLFSHTFL